MRFGRSYWVLVLVYSSALHLAREGECISSVGCNGKLNEDVSVFTEEAVNVMGCYSGALENKEIHALKLLNGNAVDRRKNSNAPMLLNIYPSWPKKSPLSSVVIILDFIGPLKWHVKLHDAGNITKFHVVVNELSQVTSNSVISISHHQLPQTKRLHQWIRSHFGPVTSYSAIFAASEISLFAGLNPEGVPEKCENLKNHVSSVNVKAVWAKIQPVTGCSTENTKDYKNNLVYVIELKSSPKKSTVLQIAETLKGESERSNDSFGNVILVLKCHDPIEWTVDAQKFHGILHIVAEHSVHVTSNPTRTATIIEEVVLPSTTDELLTSITDIYGAIYSYVYADAADRVNIDYNASIVPSKYSADVFDEEVSNETDDSVFIMRMARYMNVQCSKENMHVSFPLPEITELLNGRLSSYSKLLSINWMDPQCKAEKNETHLFLRTGLQDCKTKPYIDGQMEYHNQVQFTFTKFESIRGLARNRKRLPTDDDDYISEEGSGSKGIDPGSAECCNVGHFTFPLPVQCSRNIGADSLKTSEKLGLRIFHKKTFEDPISPEAFPMKIVVHDHLFAEASIEADKRVCLVVDECWLSEDDGTTTSTSSKSVLIKQSCPTDLSVDILTHSHCGTRSPDVDHYKLRFSFQLSEELLDQNLYLHCQLSSCAMQDNHILKARKCVVTENFCLRQSLRPYLDSLQGKKFSRLVQGPFRVIAKPNKPKQKGILPYFIPQFITERTLEPSEVNFPFNSILEENKSNPVSQQLIFIGLSTEAVVGIAFASFIIGVGLMATLWFVHMQTEPLRETIEVEKQSSSHEDHLTFTTDFMDAPEKGSA